MKILLTIFISLLGINYLSGQLSYSHPGAPLIQYVGSEDYHASPTNWAIIQSQEGFLYVGNEEGILEFDGASWRLISLPNSSAVISLGMDEQGTIYVGGQGELGLLKADSLGQLQYYSLLDQIPEEYRNFSGVREVALTQEGVYFLTSFFLLRWNQGEMYPWSARTQFTSGRTFGGEYYFFEGSVGVVKVEEDSLITLVKSERYDNEPIVDILPKENDPSNSQCLYLFLNGDLSWGSETGTFSPFTADPGINNFLKNHKPSVMLPLPDGQLAIGTVTGGILLLDWDGNLLKIIDTKSGLTEGSVNALFLDQQKGLWVGMDNGLSRIDLYSPLTYWGESLGLRGGVEKIMLAYDRLFVGNRFGLFQQKLDQEAREFSTFEKIEGIPVGFSDMAMVDERLFVGTPSSLNLVYEDGSISGSIILPIRQLHGLQSEQGILLLGFMDGLVSLHQDLVADTWNMEAQFPGFTTDVYAIEEEKNGNLWVGSAYNGVRRFIIPDFMEMYESAQYEKGPYFRDMKPEIQFFGEEQGVPLGKSFPYLHADTLWLATSQGLRRFDPIENQFRLDKYAGIDTIVPVRELVADAQEQLWMLIEKDGRLEIRKRHAYSEETEVEAPLQRIFNREALTYLYPDPTDASLLWVGARSGLYLYDTSISPPDTIPLIARIRRVLVNDKAYPISESASLPYTENALTFHFAAAAFKDPEKTTYQTQLKGFDKQWSQWDTRATREYTNLSPGPYQFQVRAKDVEGKLSTIATYQFRIQPPWYQSWWALSLAAIAIMIFISFFVYLYNRWRIRKLKEENRALEKIVEVRTEEIRERNDELKETLDTLQTTQQQLIMQEKMASLGQLTMGIAHEIKNPLNFVTNFALSSVEMVDELKEELEPYISQLSQQNYENIVDLLGDIREHVGIIQQQGSRADDIVVSMMSHANDNQGERVEADLNLILKEQVNFAYKGFKSSRTGFQAEIVYELEENLPLLNLHIQDVGRVIVNIVNNALYSVEQKMQEKGGEYSPRILVQTRSQEDQIETRIRDNGIGVSEEVISQIFQQFFTTKPTGEGNIGLGLSISYDIITKGHGGSIEVGSKEGEYAECIILFPYV